jgi:uncharacterized protein
MDISEILIIAVILCIAGIIQSAAGFAYALFAAPLLLLFSNLSLPEIVTMISVCSFMQALLGAHHLRKSIPWKNTIPAIVLRVLSIFIGLMILCQLLNLNTIDVKFILGCVLCGLVALQLFIRVKPRESLHWIWGAVAFSLSGILSGFCGMGGPPLVLWVIAHDWTVKKTRSFLFTIFAASIPPQLCLLYLTFGIEIFNTVIITLLYFPAVYLGTKIGMPIGNSLSRLVLRRIVYSFLIIIGLNFIIPELISKLIH